MATQHFELDGTIELNEDTMSGAVIGTIRPLRKPDPLTAVNTIQISHNVVTIGWPASARATTYKVYRTVASVESLLNTVATLNYTDNTVSPSTAYSYRVEPVNAAGVGTSNSVSLTTLPSPIAIPDKVANVGYNAGDAQTISSIDIRWDNPGSITEFDIYFDDVLVAVVDGALSSYKRTGLTIETTYTVNVAARNAAGTGPQSDDFVASTQANTPPEWNVSTPTDIPNASVGSPFVFDFLPFTTDADGHARTFSLFSGSLPAGLAINGSTISGTPSNNSGNPYSFTIRMSDGFDTADQAFTMTVAAAPDTTGPTAPTIAATVSGAQVSIALTAAATDASGVLNYQVQRRVDGGAYAVRADITALQFPYVETGLPAGNYDYRVRGRDNSPAQNLGTFSNVVNAPVANPNPNPNTPTLIVSPSGSDQNTAVWNEGTGAGAPVTDWDLDFSLNGNPATGVGTGPWTALAVGNNTPNVKSFVHTGRTPGVIVYYRLLAKSASGQAAYVYDSATPDTRTLFAAATFSNGIVGPNATSRNSQRMQNNIYIKCAAKSQPAGAMTKWANTGDGNSLFNAAEVGGAEEYEVHICDGETIVLHGVSDTITPREGNFFMRSYLHAGNDNNSAAQTGNAWAPNITDGFRHYEGVNSSILGDNAPHNGDKCKPRSFSGFSNNAAYGIAYDTRAFYGFSLRLHKDNEEVNKANGAKQASNGSGPQLGEMNLDSLGVDGSVIVFAINIPENGWINCLDPQKRTIGATVGTQNKLWWVLKVGRSTTSNLENYNAGVFALAPVGTFAENGDAGRWTDFVIEMCLNPYLTATTDNGWKFRANTGLLRVWKSTGPYLVSGNGMNRSMNENLPYIDKTQGGLVLEITSGGVGNKAAPDPVDAPQPNLGGKHYAYMYRPVIPGGIDCYHGSYLGMAAMRLAFAEDRQHSAINGAGNSNLVSQYQGGKAGKWSDVVPRG